VEWGHGSITHIVKRIFASMLTSDVFRMCTLG